MAFYPLKQFGVWSLKFGVLFLSRSLFLKLKLKLNSKLKLVSKQILIMVLFLSASGCTTLFFQPSRVRFPYVDQEGLKYTESFFKSLDGTPLAMWYFSAEKPKGIVLQFHGNAENMSTHYKFLSFFPKEGFDLMTFDYRGYGASEGERDLDGAYDDVIAAIRYADKKARMKKLPLILIGQSLGGSLLLHALRTEHPPSLRFVMIEGSFYSYKQIAREKLGSFWLTWPLQWLAYPLISDRYSPGGKDLEKLPRVPVLLAYSTQDPVVPHHHGIQLFQEIKEPKEFWQHDYPGHLVTLLIEDGKFRKRLLEKLR